MATYLDREGIRRTFYPRRKPTECRHQWRWLPFEQRRGDVTHICRACGKTTRCPT